MGRALAAARRTARRNILRREETDGEGGMEAGMGDDDGMTRRGALVAGLASLLHDPRLLLRIFDVFT